MDHTITTAAQLDALPIPTFWRCACGYHGVKRDQGEYLLTSGRLMFRHDMHGHLPLTILWTPPTPEPVVDPSLTAAGFTLDDAAWITDLTVETGTSLPEAVEQAYLTGRDEYIAAVRDTNADPDDVAAGVAEDATFRRLGYLTEARNRWAAKRHWPRT